MQHWGISESLLPAGSQVFFREPTAWEKYRWPIVLAGMVLLAQTALIIALLTEHRRRRTAELESRQRMTELAHLNRQTTAGELSASIAHELSQPLGAIFSNTEALEIMLDSSMPGMGEVKSILADIKGADLRATEIIQRLRRLLTKAKVETKNIDLNEIVSEVIGILAAQAGARGVIINTVLTPHPLIIKGDRVQLEQVVLNLVANAIDALAEARGDVRRSTVRTQLVDEDTAELSVSDTGPGTPGCLEANL